jgi:hypothetical protein
MSIEQRRFIRFSLDIPAFRQTEDGGNQAIVLQQVSVGGCLISWDDHIYTGEEFRILLPLANGNFLPLRCKALYKFAGRGIGAKFVDINEFEQELLGDVITESLEAEGLPVQVDPFAHPPSYRNRANSEISAQASFESAEARREQEEEIVEQILSLDS